jgi:hypothetical protein
VRSHIPRFWKRILNILRRYRDCAKDPVLCQRVCQVDGKPYTDPFSNTRRWALARMTDEHLSQLIDIWKNGMSEWTQCVLGGELFSRENMLSLPTGREKLPSGRTSSASTISRPARRDWRFTPQRGVYCDYVILSDNSVELYVGKATSFNATQYRGLNARLGSYLGARSRGRIGNKSENELTPHERRIVSEEDAKINLRCLARFEDNVPREPIDLFEDLLTMYLRTSGLQPG